MKYKVKETINKIFKKKTISERLMKEIKKGQARNLISVLKDEIIPVSAHRDEPLKRNL
jgi:hypothetical protein